MNILITTGIFPPDIGGPATYVPRMAKALIKRGHRVTIIAPQTKGIPCPILNPPYRLIRFERAKILRYANYFIEFQRAFKTIRQEVPSYDVIYINGLAVPALYASQLVRKPIVIKVVGDKAWELAHNRGWTTLNLDHFQNAVGPRISIFKFIEHLPTKKAAKVIVPSKYLGQIVQGWHIDHHQIHVIYNAFSEPNSKAESFPPVPLPSTFDQGYRLLTVGRLIPHKRIESIIRIMPQLSDAKLVIVGSGPQENKLRHLAHQLSLTEQVYFTGRILPTQVWYLMQNYAETLILNSTYEGLPHILLEAAYFQVPVVATHVGGTPEVVRHNETGLLVPPDAPQELLFTLKQLADDRENRTRLARNAYHSLTKFSATQMFDQTEQVLKEAIL